TLGSHIAIGKTEYLIFPVKITTMNPSSDAGLSTGSRALQDPCAEKVLEQLRKDKQAVTTFDSFDPDIQQVAFVHLWQDYTRLHEIGRKYSVYDKWCPAADGDLYTADARTRLFDDAANSNDLNNKASAEGTRDHFRAVWQYRDPSDDYPPSRSDDDVSWDSWNLLIPSSSERHFELCQCVEERRCGSCGCDNWKKAGLHVWETISSQLLLYRLTAVFGMPPLHPDVGYKTCWTVELIYCKDTKNVFMLEDYKGGVNVHFHGSKEAGISAVDLLNWLISNKVPHEYDGILAGTVA
ncbi:hypothetical protein LTS03_011682, partial [Exophiala xenobiotica]